MPEPNKTLLTCIVVGSKFYEGRQNLNLFQPGTLVALIPEPENEFDPQAVAVYAFDDHIKLGHIPKKTVGYAQIVSTLLANGIALKATVVSISEKSYDPVTISIALAE